MACLFQRSNGVWYIVHSEGRKRRWFSTGTENYEDAKRIFTDMWGGNTRRGPLSISDFMAEYKRYGSVNHSIATQKLYAHCLARFRECVGDKPMRLLSVKDIERYKIARLKTITPSSVNVELRTLKAAFNVALDWGMIQQNPFCKSKLLRVPHKEPAYLTKQEFQALLDKVSGPEFRDLLLFAVLTMMRRSEIINLTWDDINFDRNCIHVRSKEGFAVKSLRDRIVPMNRTVRALLSQKRRDGKYVFTGPNGKFRPGYLSHQFKKYARACRLPESLHFHCLRHTGATWLVQGEVSIYAVQKILGHTKPDMTQVYAHHSDRSLCQAIEKIDFIPAGSALT